MKKFKVYDVYMDDGRDVFKVVIPAESKQAATKAVAGNGEVVKIRENTLVPNIDCNALANTLRKNAWGDAEIQVITRTLAAVGLER